MKELIYLLEQKKKLKWRNLITLSKQELEISIETIKILKTLNFLDSQILHK